MNNQKPQLDYPSAFILVLLAFFLQQYQNKQLLTSVLGGEMQNWIRPILAFSILCGPPLPETDLSNTIPSINSVSSTVPLDISYGILFDTTV